MGRLDERELGEQVKIREWSDEIKGTEDWVKVFRVDFGESYEWDEIHVFYSPSARRYFIASGSGCSCNSITDEYYNAGDFQDGNKQWAIDTVRDYVNNSYRGSPLQAQAAAAEIRKFSPSSVDKQNK